MKSLSNLSRLALLLLLSAGAAALRAQDNGGTDTTNQVMTADDQSAVATAAAAAATTTTSDSDTTDSSATSTTNTVAEEPVSRTSASAQPSGRDSRNRWSRNKRSSQSNRYSADYSASTSDTNTGPASLEYPAFQVIAQKNIFDPNRRPNAPRRQRDTTRPPQVDSFSLVGTMTYEKGTFAFFSGSSSRYEKALKPAGEIAGYTVAAVSANAVKLVAGTNEVDLKVGYQLRREDEGPWTVSAGSAARSGGGGYGGSSSSYSSRSSSFGGGPSSPPVATPPPSGPQGDILKRMMQRREQE
jgi:hypothetical protein